MRKQVPLPVAQGAEYLGAGRGSVTDIYLPAWFARNPPAIHVPLLAPSSFTDGTSTGAKLCRPRHPLNRLQVVSANGPLAARPKWRR